MADWTDGPEYAPQQRPDAFEAPEAPSLTLVESAGPADEGGSPPAQTPTFGAPEPGRPLHELGIPHRDDRDPATPFAVVTTPLTSAAHTNGQAPSQPLLLSSQAESLDLFVAAPGSTTGHVPQARWEPPEHLPSSVPVPHSSPWGAAHAPQSAPRPHETWAPRQPFSLPPGPVGSPDHPAGQQAPVNPQSFPSADADRWYGGYGQAPQPASEPVTVRAVVDAAHPAVLGCLAGGALAPWFGLAFLSVPLVIVAMFLAQRLTRHRRLRIRRVFTAVVGGSLLLGLLGALDSYDPLPVALTESWSGWAQLASWVMLVAVPLIVGGALRRREPPEA